MDRDFGWGEAVGVELPLNGQKQERRVEEVVKKGLKTIENDYKVSKRSRKEIRKD